MPDYKSRTVTYLRAVWHDRNDLQLASLLEAAHDKLPTTEKRTFAYRDGTLQGISHKRSEGGIYGHIAYAVEGEPASLLKKPCDLPEHDLTEQDPPEGHDYMRADGFFFVRENHVIVCTSNLNSAAIRSYIRALLAEAEQEGPGLQLENVANTDTLTVLAEEGVRNIQLEASIYQATHSYIDRGRDRSFRERVIGGVGEAILSMIGAGNTALRSIAQDENVNVRVALILDQKSKKSGLVGTERIKEAAGLLLDEGSDQYLIETRAGTKIRPGEIRLQRTIRVPTQGNSINRAQTWDALYAYFDELQREGRLEE